MNRKPTFASFKSQWWGVCIGGRHYTGTINVGNKRTELERKLSRKEAKQMAEECGRDWLARQTVTNQFNDRASLERAAVKWAKAHLRSPWILFDGDELNPSRALAAAGWIEKRIPLINELAAAWEKIPDHLRKGEAWDATYKAWDLLLNPRAKI